MAHAQATYLQEGTENAEEESLYHSRKEFIPAISGRIYSEPNSLASGS